MADEENKPKESAPVQTAKFTGHQQLIVALLALTQFTVVLDLMVMSPLGDFVMKSLNITTKQFGLTVSSYAFSAAVSGLLTAGFADKFDRKKLLQFFYFGFIIGTGLCAIATSYEFLLMARIVTGLFGGVIGSISLTIVTDLFPLQMRGRALGILQMSFSASQVLGIPAGLYFANLFNWHAPFIMIVALAAIIVVMLSLFLEPVRAHLLVQKKGTVWQHYGAVLGRKNYRLGFVTIALSSIGGFIMQPFASPYFINNLKVSPKHLFLIFLFTGIATFIVTPFIGKLSDKMSKFKLFLTGSLLAMVMTFAYTNLFPMPLWIIIVVSILMFLSVTCRQVPLLATISAIPDANDRGAYMSINSAMQQFAGGIAAAIGGFIIFQKSQGSPIENFPVLGYINIFIMLISIFFMNAISKVIQNKTR